MSHNDGEDHINMESQNSMEEEEKRMRRLKVIVDLTAAVLAQEKLTIDEALDLMNATRRAALRLFPGTEQTYDMIYGKRFQRILRGRFEDMRSRADNVNGQND